MYYSHSFQKAQIVVNSQKLPHQAEFIGSWHHEVVGFIRGDEWLVCMRSPLMVWTIKTVLYVFYAAIAVRFLEAM